MALRLVVGLGNPGPRYEKTRHNLGFMVVSRLVEEYDGRFRSTRFGEVAEVGQLRVLKPQTFMNLSGEAVGPLCHFYRIAPEELIVVADDLDLPVGTMRMRRGGSSGGHNGLKSIGQALHTDEYPRLRLGISRPIDGMNVIDWVLGRFSPSERPIMEAVMEKALKALQCLERNGIETAMSRYNG